MDDDLYDDLRIRPDRLHASIDALADIGRRSDGGVCRLAFTAAHRAGRDHVAARMRALGLSVRTDGIGNLLGVRAGRAAAPMVMTGSHTDTVATGGRLDGALGVLAGLEALATLHDAGVVTRRPLAVMDFANEEGSRYAPGMMGSQVLTGRLPLDAARSRTDADGAVLGDDLDRHGLAGTDDFTGLDLHSFVELHIEQGPVLENARQAIGIVDRVQGITWLAFRFRGQANHAGTTPMHLRHDAGYVAATVAAFVRRLAQEVGGSQVATAGHLRFVPNLANVIPAEATLMVDLRNPEADRLAAAEARLRQFAAEQAAAEGVAVEIDVRTRMAPVDFHPDVVAAVAAATAHLGYPARRMHSGAGHDAQVLAGRCPTAMIFVPSIGGISHNVQEATRPEDLEAGTNVLLHTLLRLAA